MNIKLHTNIINSLNIFTSHGLADLDNASLMNRIDSKFILPIDQLTDILTSMSDYYTILEIGNKRIFNYENFYYDTEDFHLYLSHHNGKLNRHKVRYRSYLDSGTSYLEVKFKNNKKRTIKSRIKVTTSPESAITNSLEFLKECGIINPKNLKVAQKSTYHRIALANEAAAERLTIDIDLRYFAEGKQDDIYFDRHVIAELKQSSLNRQSPFYRLMRERGIRPASFSKYCMGVYFDSSNKLKKNNFKPIGLSICPDRSSSTL